MSTYTLRDAAQMFGLRYVTLQRWVLYDHLVPTLPPAQGRAKRLDLRGMLCVGLITRLREQAVSIGTIRRVTDFLSDITEAELLEAVEQGRSILVDAGSACLPALLEPTATILNRCGHDELLLAIDIAAALSRLQASLHRRSEPIGWDTCMNN